MGIDLPLPADSKQTQHPIPFPGHGSAVRYLGKSPACSSDDEHSPGHLISPFPKGSEMVAAAPTRMREKLSGVCRG